MLNGQTAASSENRPLLYLEHVSKRFSLGGIGRNRKMLTAVDNVDISLARGECVGLVGESGSGKSTIGRMACGLLAPSQGHVFFDGHVLPPAGAKSWAAGRIQMIFQDPVSSLNPRLRVRTSVAEPLGKKSISRAERHELAEDMLSEVGLAGLGDRYPHEFSGGQRQRIAIARALITRPDVIVCDEPVSALDASVQAQTLNLLRDVQEHFGPSYVFISHNLAVVGFMCHRILVMYLGQIVEEAPTEELFARASHPFTQELLASLSDLTCKNYSDSRCSQGEVPSPLSLPKACHYHHRCPKAKDICRQTPPPWKALDNRHHVRCWNAYD